MKTRIALRLSYVSAAWAVAVFGTALSSATGCSSTPGSSASSGGIAESGNGSGVPSGSGSIGASGNGSAASGAAMSGSPLSSGGVNGGTGASSGSSSGQSTSSGSVSQSGAEVISDAAVEGASATAPAFGSNVVVFSPSMSMTSIQSQLDSVYNMQLSNQFGTTRYCFLFLPGHYTLNVRVAYYMQVLGLGASPDDVVITG